MKTITGSNLLSGIFFGTYGQCKFHEDAEMFHEKVFSLTIGR